MPRQSARKPSVTSQESYSAVIIADLVAEVQVPEETEPEAITTKCSKEETNLGYDGHLDGSSSPATVKPDATEVVALRSIKANGASISKGVILNAVQFGQDSNAKGDDKAIQLANSLSVQGLTQPSSEPSGFKDMSILRKIAFAFSFLPSIMFVLCFAIILPCNVPEPCIKTVWIWTSNNTEAIPSLEISQNVVFSIVENNTNYFVSLDANKGSINYKKEISAKVTYLHCGKVTNKDQNDCIIMDETGKILIFNSTTGRVLWEPVTEEKHSQPLTLPDCNGETEAIVVAVSNTQVKVLSKGNIVSKFEIRDCDTVPDRLISWTRNGSSDIIVTCNEGGKEIMHKIPQNTWCFSDKESPGNTWMHPKMDPREYIIYPIEHGLVLWTGDEVSMLLHDGSEEWKITNDSHSDKNRFILYGNFIGEHKQVALLSSDISSKLQISILNATDGSIMKSQSINSSEAIEVIQIQGTNRDFVLTILNTIRKDAVTATLEHINAISTTVINFISNEGIADSPSLFTTGTEQELVLLDLDGTIHSIEKLKDAHSGVAMAAVHHGELLNIYLLRSLQDSSSSKMTEVRNIEVANWDISAAKSPQCTL